MAKRLTGSRLVIWCAVALLALAGYHLMLRWLMLRHGLRLGAVSDELVPFYGYWRPHLKGWLLVPLVTVGCYLVWLRRSRAGTWSTEAEAKRSFCLALALVAATVAMIDGGPEALVEPLLRTDLEYSGAVEQVDAAGGPVPFLRYYPSLNEQLPMHARVHPPGAVLALWVVRRLFGPAVAWMALCIIGFTSLSAVIVYGWAGAVGGPGVARRAAALYVLSPSVVLFTATSMDGPFAVLLIGTMYLYWRALAGGACRFGLLAGMCAAVAATMTYSVAVAAAFCAAVTLVRLVQRPGQWRGYAQAAGCAVAAVIAVHLLMWLAAGYNPIETFRTCMAAHRQIMAGSGHGTAGRWALLGVSNLVVFFLAAGLPISILWWPLLFSYRAQPPVGRLAAAAAAVAGPGPAAGQVTSPAAGNTGWRPAVELAGAGAVTLTLAAAAPVYTLEVERIWMFLVPVVVIPVAQTLFDQERGTGKVAATLTVARLLAAQTLLTEVLVTTYW